MPIFGILSGERTFVTLFKVFFFMGAFWLNSIFPGMLTNFKELKSDLLESDPYIQFATETDTEVVAKMAQAIYQKSGGNISLKDIVEQICLKLASIFNSSLFIWNLKTSNSRLNFPKIFKKLSKKQDIQAQVILQVYETKNCKSNLRCSKEACLSPCRSFLDNRIMELNNMWVFKWTADLCLILKLVLFIFVLN